MKPNDQCSWLPDTATDNNAARERAVYLLRLSRTMTLCVQISAQLGLYRHTRYEQSVISLWTHHECKRHHTSDVRTNDCSMALLALVRSASSAAVLAALSSLRLRSLANSSSYLARSC